MCNKTTGKVEVAPSPPSVECREASYNTVALRRAISQLWEDECTVSELQRQREAIAQAWGGSPLWPATPSAGAGNVEPRRQHWSSQVTGPARDAEVPQAPEAEPQPTRVGQRRQLSHATESVARELAFLLFPSSSAIAAS